MLSKMLTHSTIVYVNYEDIQHFIKSGQTNIILINTLSLHEQNCLIKKTLNANLETEFINKHLGDSNLKIIIYGKNATDESIKKKYDQLNSLGVKSLYIYPGGLFEWLLLQDIYGKEMFPTTTNMLDILKFKGKKKLFV